MRSSRRTPKRMGAGRALGLSLLGGLVFCLSSNSTDLQDSPTQNQALEGCSTGMLSTPWTVEASDVEDVAGGDIAPVRTVADPYPSLHSVAVDPENDRVLMSDSNRGGLLVYDRSTRSLSSNVARPVTQVRGPATGMMFVAGVALDPGNHELFAVNNDIGDRMEVFPYDAEGNVRPKRILFVPHGSWGLALNRQRDEVAITVEHANTVVVYRRDATLGDAPLRVLHGPNTGLLTRSAMKFLSRIMAIGRHSRARNLCKAESKAAGSTCPRFQPTRATRRTMRLLCARSRESGPGSTGRWV
jgi:hypothetical protein